MGIYAAQKILWSSRLEKGLCQRCGNFPHSENKKTCVFCSIKQTGRGAPLEKRRIKQGLCRKCGKSPFATGRTMCRPCLEKCRIKALEHYKNKKVPILQAVHDHYGNVCSCCGETDPLFLTIDHVNSDGAEHRKNYVGASQLPTWLVENDFPEGFQLLCFNCNCGRQRNGGICPHKKEKMRCG